MPANNVLISFFAGLVTVILLHYAKRMGYNVPQDISDGLSAAIVVALAHACDLFTGDNKRKIIYPAEVSPHDPVAIPPQHTQA